jgi:hypothetical protein
MKKHKRKSKNKIQTYEIDKQNLSNYGIKFKLVEKQEE